MSQDDLFTHRNCMAPRVYDCAISTVGLITLLSRAEQDKIIASIRLCTIHGADDDPENVALTKIADALQVLVESTR